MSGAKSTKDVVVETDQYGNEKVRAFCETGKQFDDGRPVKGVVELYKSVVYSGRSKTNPYGSRTDIPCYRMKLSYPSIGFNAAGLKTLAKAIVLLEKEYPLE